MIPWLRIFRTEMPGCMGHGFPLSRPFDKLRITGNVNTL